MTKLKASHPFKGKPGGLCRFVYAGDTGESLGPCNASAANHETRATVASRRK